MFLYGKLALNLLNKRLGRGESSSVELNNWYPIPLPCISEPNCIEFLKKEAWHFHKIWKKGKKHLIEMLQE